MGKIKQKIKIDRFYVLVEDCDGVDVASFVGIDREGNEYRIDGQVYVHGEYYDCEFDVIKTELSTKEKLKRNL